ncbi:MAG: phosphate/phosphite/phosphonate ABC transporter substrate-binding protein [Nitrospiraceae bacterium]|nr:phosphate/phosphite/phosphonate ABC transporter substrate-binding protein [Nitrospiraceae bacterium]
MTKVLFPALIVFVVIGLAACRGKESPKRISLEKKESAAVTAGRDKEKHLRIAVGGMITPKEGLAYYRQFLDYIEEKLGMKVDFVAREDYAEINDMIREGNLEAAFVCSGPYVDGHREFGMELLVAPQVYGKTVYYSYIIVARASSINRFEDLRGKSFAFADPLSNTGKLVPTYMLAKMKEKPDTFFGKYVFTNAHDKSIKAVAQNIVDGAAVDSLIWEYENSTNSEFTSKTRIIEKSAPYAIPPVVVSRNLDPRLKERLRQIFLNAGADPRGRELLGKMKIDKFVLINDRAYNSVREMKSWLAKQRQG